MKKRIILPPTKTELFLEQYLKTGNATESAMRVFNCSSRASAQAIGSYYLKKSQPLTRILFEKNGFPIGKLIDVAIEKFEIIGSVDWFDRLTIIGDFHA